MIKFFFWQFLARGLLSPAAGSLDQPHFQYRPLISFWEQNAQEILRILSQWPLSDIRFHMKDASLDILLADGLTNVFGGDLALALRGKAVMADGAVRTGTSPSHNPLRFHARGMIEPAGISTLDFVLERDDLYAKLWGNYHSGRLQLNGFSWMDTLAKIDNPQKSSNKPRWLNGIFNRLQGRERTPPVWNPNLYILDIGCRARLAFPQTEIEAIVFTINNAPISMKGRIFWENPVAFDGTASFYPSPFPSKPMESFTRTDLALSGRFQNNTLKTIGTLSSYFNSQDHDLMPFEKIVIDFQDGTWGWDAHSRLNLHLGKEEDSLTLDFQLSGRQEAMNFQWLDSEIKQKIQSWIPNFIERKIERTIEERL